MKNKILLSLIVATLTLGSGLAQAATHSTTTHKTATVQNAPPAAPYKAVSSLVKLPDFLPGMGQLFVDPNSLPAGPFLAYDHNGKLVSTIYMIPIAAMKPDMNINDLVAPGGKVDHVDIMYNAGHPGVAEPHIHIVLWHVSVKDEARVAK